ncbi:MAG TPA: ATP-binding cassette domain-containing protein [Ignavibacteria bacterium]|nr:ABC transporter ATP-binding protein [Bacteroidota bacterium]HRI85154.1 ATP-binding cassette domain-containing protein [Ignavibacteria bacterium]HRJ99496.1 ATP-binding cassette domain-containing protein [Ignavibacteria bacterium]HRK00084.1 ATP-binding cassette domain-containing protein [Ignavibacteria bacterium]
MKENIIEVKNLVKKYNSLVAVDGISFNVRVGEVFGLLGPNGAGKTTTLEIMETLRDKTSGEVFINGLSVDENQNEIKKIIGIQLQAAGFYPNLYLNELIELFAGLYNVYTDPDELLDLVDLRDKKNSKYKELSGGQKQRFSVCTTLINEPKLIFLDEPTTGLDPQARRNLWELIKRIKAKGTTIMLTTHYMDEAEILCDRVGIIDHGNIIAIDSPDNLIDDLVRSGFERPKQVKLASLEDVFINLTGHSIRDV